MKTSEYEQQGGAAYPLSTDRFFQRGMSLRDWFAGQALMAMVVKGHCIDSNVSDAYKYADAMLKERSKPKEG